MSDITAQHDSAAVRASDAEREQTVALLQRNFVEGRLTQAELEERAGAAYAARTRAQLCDLTADLPDARKQPPRRRLRLDPCVLCTILMCAHPPAGVAYYLLCFRHTGHRRATAATPPAEISAPGVDSAVA